MHAIRLIGSLLWQAAVIKLAVEWLSETDNRRRSRCTWNAAFYVAMWFAVLDLIGLIVAGALPFGSAISWALKLVGAYAAFGGYFGLKPIRAIAIAPLLHLSAALWRALIEPILPC